MDHRTRRPLPSLPALRAFEAAARHRSFGRAAAELLVTQSAISHQIRKLEAELGVPLFTRRTRGVDLTEAGTRYLAVVAEAFDRIAGETARLRGPAPRLLRVSLLASFAANWLVSRLPRFNALHQGITVILDPAIRPVDLAAEGIDLAVRYGRGGWEGVRSRRLMGERICPVCSPALLERGPPLREPRDVLGHPLLLSYSREPLEWPAWSRSAGVDLSGAREVMLHDYNIVLQAALEGQGVAMGRRALLSERLRDGSLVEPFPGTAVTDATAYWILLPAAGGTPEAEIFADWLAEEAASHA
ncbi:transcriptional regulator GcvA [Arenibaculum pallidiluteum]|uniref:transcriptional regulator GcvA n=1 Tax=Arenibaculum pallidiluteum TaxID=2812559 RepID=UPI001A96F157|nr:transcriptional regulator GcvA [Arenibaculum pallidiluteum]